MIETLRRAVSLAGGLRGIAAFVAVAWGMQELAAQVEARSDQLAQLQDAHAAAGAAFLAETKMWEQRRAGESLRAAMAAAAVPVVVEVIDAEVVEDTPPDEQP